MSQSRWTRTACNSGGATFAWQVLHFDSLGIAGARLVAAGLRLQLRGRRSTWCSCRYFCVAGAALWLSGDCWRAAGLRLQLRGRRSTWCSWRYFCDKRVKECKCISDIRGKYLKRNGKRKVWKKYVTSTDKPLKSYWLNENNNKKYLENLVTKEGEV